MNIMTKNKQKHKDIFIYIYQKGLKYMKLRDIANNIIKNKDKNKSMEGYVDGRI